MSNLIPVYNYGSRGISLFSQEQLDHIIKTTVLPEVDDTHQLTFVGSTTSSGASAGIVFRKTGPIEWSVEAAFTYDWDTKKSGVGTRLLFKL